MFTQEMIDFVVFRFEMRIFQRINNIQSGDPITKEETELFNKMRVIAANLNQVEIAMLNMPSAAAINKALENC